MADLKSEKDQVANLEKLFSEKKFEELLILAEKLLDDFPDSFQIRFLYTQVLREVGRFGEAETLLKELCAAYPDNINLLSEMGAVLIEHEKYEEAVECFNKILFLDPFNEAAKGSLNKIDQLKKGPPLPSTPPPPAASVQEPEVEPPPSSRKEAVFKMDTLPEDEIPPPLPPEPAAPQQQAIGVQEAAVEGKAKEEEFMTESAAELYMSQGLYDDALTVYKKLYEEQQQERFLSRINELRQKRITQKKIQVLSLFSRLIAQQGESVV